MPIEPGTKLGQYEVLELIGEGAMGTVYRAYHAQLARTGAVKVMHAISPDSDSIARFRHEAQAIARMRHQNILNVFDFGEYEGTPYMIVEYVPGGNLAGRMNQGLLPWGTAMRFLHGIAAGLDYAHSQGIVHRDVKPANVLLEKDETLVLADFGLAKLLRGSSLQSLTGVTTGTPAYMAPEQVTGQEVGPAADRYSLATIAYEMLTGSIPFEGLGVIELLYAHVHSDPARPSTLNPQLNEKVDAVIMRGLAKAPGSRWATCEAFVNALAAALGAKAAAGVEKTVAMAPAPAVDRTIAMGAGAHDSEGLFAPPPTTAPPPVWAPAVAAKRRARRRRIAIIVIAIVALLALIGGTVSLVLGELFKPALSLSSPMVEPGSILTVSAGHLPANQVGQIELLSQLYSFPFSADANGSVSQKITIPRDIGIGAHHVSVCWANSCPLRVALTVVAPVARRTPGGSPGPSPTANPTTSPRPTPTPTLNPCPTPTSGAALTANPTTVVGGRSVTLTGTNFTPYRVVTLRYYRGSTLILTWTTVAICNGSFTTGVRTAAGVVRTDHVTARDAAGRTATVKISIIL
ncbi:MAG TPA: serine/threonine-protein kinase [Candidatus Dormibacteraeota bacterium]